jgi:hypothetical protein
VFYPEYHLRPLTELSAYIDTNHHLPEIPTAEDVAEKGVDLGEINKLLLKKVEELTLYLIQKDEQLKQQAAEIEKIERRMAKIEKEKAK